MVVYTCTYKLDRAYLEQPVALIAQQNGISHRKHFGIILDKTAAYIYDEKCWKRGCGASSESHEYSFMMISSESPLTTPA